MRKKLTKKQKAKNKAAYKKIRKEYEAVREKSEVKITYMQFKHRVLGRAKKDNINIKEAAKKEARTKTFLSPAERSRENLLESLKTNYSESYNQLKNLSRSHGKYQKISENLTWDTGRNAYVLNANGKSYVIDVTNSPEEVNIEEII